ncbi:hypothetical protein H4R35_001491 [Dimargaris xerosporica]|nr:hypothetical protein H4R35_001491 [Dimargaris xerosporica]
MAPPPTVEVSLLQEADHQYSNSDWITGAVIFKTYYPIYACRIVLSFVGQEVVGLRANLAKDRCLRKVYFRQDLVVWGDQLGAVESMIPTGTHIIPFNCQLPALNYPASTYSRSRYDGGTPQPSFSIDYSFQAVVEARGFQCTSPVVPIWYTPTIWPKTMAHGHLQPTLVSEPVFSEIPMVDSDGRETSYRLKAALSHREYVPGELLQLEMEVTHAKSLSPKVLDSECALRETIECFLDGRHHSSQDRHKAVWCQSQTLVTAEPQLEDSPKPPSVVSPMKARRRALSNAATTLLTMRGPSIDAIAAPEKEPLNAFSSSRPSCDQPRRCVVRCTVPATVRPMDSAHLRFTYDLVVTVRVPTGYFKRKSGKVLRAVLPLSLVTRNKYVRHPDPAASMSPSHPPSRGSYSDVSDCDSQVTVLNDSIIASPQYVESGLDYADAEQSQPLLMFSDANPSLWLPAHVANLVSIQTTGQRRTYSIYDKPINLETSAVSFDAKLNRSRPTFGLYDYPSRGAGASTRVFAF